MQRLNEDFLDTLSHKDVTEPNKEELTVNDQKEPHEFRFWMTIRTIGFSNLEEDYVIERIRKVLERCLYITSWSKIYAKRSTSKNWMSSENEDDPVSFGFNAEFKNVASVMRFIESLRYIFGSSMNITITLTEKNSIEEATIITSYLDNIKAPLKGERLNPYEFFLVVKMVDMFLSPEHDVINELNNFIGKGDYSSQFRQTVLKQTISTLKYSRRNRQLPVGGKISDVNEFKSLHVPISQIAEVEKNNPEAYIQIGISNAYKDYTLPLLKPASYVANATFDGYLGLTDINPSAISMIFIRQLGMEANERYICVIYGNHYRNGYGVITMAGLVVATKTKEEMEKILNEIFTPVEIKITQIQDNFGVNSVDWKEK